MTTRPSHSAVPAVMHGPPATDSAPTAAAAPASPSPPAASGPVAAPADANAAAPGCRLSWVPIRSLTSRHRSRIQTHLQSLDEHDRYFRFGYQANDAQIARYADSIDFERDEVFGIFNRHLELIAMAHLAYETSPKLTARGAMAEFGVSVAAKACGRGYGARLFDRAAMHARNDGVDLMFIHALSENTAMLKIARNAGATVERDGSEAEAYLRLTPPTFDTRMTEMLEEQLAQADYRIKVQAKHFWDFLATAQRIRCGGAEASRDLPA